MLQVSVQADFLLLGFLKTEQNHTRDQIKIASALWEQIRSARIQAFVTPRCFDQVCSALSGYPNAKEVIASIRSVLEVLPHDPILDEIAAASESPYDYAVEVAYAREYGLDGMIADSRQGFSESGQEMTIFLPGALLLEVQQLDAFNSSDWTQISNRYREESLNADSHSEDSDQNKLEDIPPNRSSNAGEPSYTKGNHQPIYRSDKAETPSEENVLSTAAYSTIRSAIGQSQAAVRVETGLTNQALTFEQAFSANTALVWIRYTSAADFKPTDAARNPESSWLTSLLPFKQDLLDLNKRPPSANAQIDSRPNQGLLVTVLSANSQEFTRQNFFEFNQILSDRSPRIDPTNPQTQPLLIPSNELVDSVRAVVRASRNPKPEAAPNPGRTIADWQIFSTEDPTLHLIKHLPNLEISVGEQTSQVPMFPTPAANMDPANASAVGTPTPISPLVHPASSPAHVTPPMQPPVLLVREGNPPQGDGSLDASAVLLSPENSDVEKKVALQIDPDLRKSDLVTVTVALFQKSEKFGLIGGANYDDSTAKKSTSESESNSPTIAISLQLNLQQTTILGVNSQTLSQEFELKRSQPTQALHYNGSTAWTMGEAYTNPLGEIKLEFAFSRLAGQSTTLHMWHL
jgi:hypothetical protein